MRRVTAFGVCYAFDTLGVPTKAELGKLTDLNYLSLRSSKINDLSFLPVLPEMTHLDATGSKLEALTGSVVQPKLTDFYCANTPLAKQTYITLMACIAFGPSLERVNGVPVPEEEATVADSVRQSIRPYIAAGYLLSSVYPFRLYHPINRKRKTFYFSPVSVSKVGKYHSPYVPRVYPTVFPEGSGSKLINTPKRINSTKRVSTSRLSGTPTSRRALTRANSTRDTEVSLTAEDHAELLDQVLALEKRAPTVVNSGASRRRFDLYLSDSSTDESDEYSASFYAEEEQ